MTAALAYVLVVHLPGLLDGAAAVPPLHATLHAGLFVAGAVVGASWRDVTELARVPARLSRSSHPVLSAAIALPLGILIVAAYRAG